MLTRAFIQQLKDLIANGETEAVFDKIWPQQAFIKPELYDELVRLSGRFIEAKKKFKQAEINFDQYTNATSQCKSALLDILNELEKFISDKPYVPLHLIYACDRGEQYTRFVSLITTPGRPKLHFYYLYGGEAQSHKGIFTRFVNRLKGLDRLNTSQSGYQVCDFSITIPSLENIQCLSTELPRFVLSEMGITDKEMEQVGEKNLHFGLTKSPLLASADKILVHICITEAVWNNQITPEMTRVFVEEFCLSQAIPDTTEVFFFFSVEYDDDNTAIREQIETALTNATFLKNMGELKMVTPAHVDTWFIDFNDLWETVTERKAAKARYFAEMPPESYMDDIQIKLKKLINELNQNDIYGKR